MTTTTRRCRRTAAPVIVTLAVVAVAVHCGVLVLAQTPPSPPSPPSPSPSSFEQALSMLSELRPQLPDDVHSVTDVCVFDCEKTCTLNYTDPLYAVDLFELGAANVAAGVLGATDPSPLARFSTHNVRWLLERCAALRCTTVDQVALAATLERVRMANLSATSVSRIDAGIDDAPTLRVDDALLRSCRAALYTTAELESIDPRVECTSTCKPRCYNFTLESYECVLHCSSTLHSFGSLGCQLQCEEVGCSDSCPSLAGPPLPHCAGERPAAAAAAAVSNASVGVTLELEQRELAARLRAFAPGSSAPDLRRWVDDDDDSDGIVVHNTANGAGATFATGQPSAASVELVVNALSPGRVFRDRVLRPSDFDRFARCADAAVPSVYSDAVRGCVPRLERGAGGCVAAMNAAMGDACEALELEECRRAICVDGTACNLRRDRCRPAGNTTLSLDDGGGALPPPRPSVATTTTTTTTTSSTGTSSLTSSFSQFLPDSVNSGPACVFGCATRNNCTVACVNNCTRLPPDYAYECTGIVCITNCNSTVLDANERQNEQEGALLLTSVLGIAVALFIFLFVELVRTLAVDSGYVRAIYLLRTYSGAFRFEDTALRFRWLYTVLWKFDETKMIRMRGIEVTMALTFLRYQMNTFAALAIYSLLLLLPVNYSGDNRLRSPLDPLATQGHASITLANIPDGSSTMWFHLISVYVLTAVFLVQLFVCWRKFTQLRLQRRTRNIVDNYAVLVTDIPPFPPSVRLAEHADTIVRLYFERVFGVGCVASVHVAWAPGKLRDIVHAYRDCVARLRRAQLDYADARERAERKGRAASEAKRPRVRLGTLGLRGERVDALVHYAREERRLRTELTEYQTRGEPEEGFAPSAVVLFKRKVTAALAASSSISLHQTTWNVTEGCQPRDLRWTSLAMRSSERYPITIVARLAVAAIVLFWSIPTTFAASLANIDSLAEVDGFEWLADLKGTFVGALVQGLLPVIVQLVFGEIAEALIKFATWWEQWPRKSMAEHRVISRFWMFLYVNTFIIYAISGTVLLQIDQLQESLSFTAIVDLLSQSLPQQSLFFCNFIAAQALIMFPLIHLQIFPLLFRWLRLRFFARTETEKYQVDHPPSGHHPASFYWAKFYTRVLLVLGMGIAYISMDPLLPLYAAAFFAVVFVVVKYHFVYSYVPAFDSDGHYWTCVPLRVMWSLVLYQLLMIAMFVSKDFNIGLLVAPLPFVLTPAAYLWMKSRFEVVSTYGSLEALSSDAHREFSATGLPLDAYLQPWRQRLVPVRQRRGTEPAETHAAAGGGGGSGSGSGGGGGSGDGGGGEGESQWQRLRKQSLFGETRNDSKKVDVNVLNARAAVAAQEHDEMLAEHDEKQRLADEQAARAAQRTTNFVAPSAASLVVANIDAEAGDDGVLFEVPFYGATRHEQEEDECEQEAKHPEFVGHADPKHKSGLSFRMASAARFGPLPNDGTDHRHAHAAATASGDKKHGGAIGSDEATIDVRADGEASSPPTAGIELEELPSADEQQHKGDGDAADAAADDAEHKEKRERRKHKHDRRHKKEKHREH